MSDRDRIEVNVVEEKAGYREGTASAIPTPSAGQRGWHMPVKVARNCVRAAGLLVVTVVMLAIIAIALLHFVILPHIERWRPQLEERASTALGVQVRIGAIDVDSGSLAPSITLRDVVLLDAAQREALRLPRISAIVSARSLLTLQVRFSSLVIDGAALDLRRDARDRLYVAGLEVGGSTGDSGDTSALDWFFKQREFAIRRGSITWTDERRDGVPLSLTDVDVVVRNGLVSHEFRVDATPPADWGDRFTLRGRFKQKLLARSGDWEHWSGEAFVDLPRADVRQLRNRITLPFDLSEGQGAVRAWVDVRAGVARRATVDVSLHSVAIRLRAEPGAQPLAPLSFAELQGRFVGLYDVDRSSVALQKFGFTTPDGQTWPQGDMSLAWDGPASGPARGGVLTAQHVDLGLTARIADGLPLGDGLRRSLAELQPRGAVNDLLYTWTGPLQTPSRYQVKASVRELALQAGPPPIVPVPAGHAPIHEPGRPGLRNASADVTATERGGEARLSIKQGSIDFPGVFEQSEVPFDALSASVSWRIEGSGADDPARRAIVQVRDLQFSNADAEGEIDATWRVGIGSAARRAAPASVIGSAPDRGPAVVAPTHASNAPTSRLGVLELTANLSRGQADRVYRYFPLELPADTRHYVERAIRRGSLDTARVLVRGDLADFPFRRVHSGDFRVEARFHDVDFDYAPAQGQTVADTSRSGSAAASPPHAEWPMATGVSGQIVVDRTAMNLKDLQGKILGVDLSSVGGTIADFDHAVLSMDGKARGPLPDFLRFVRSTPVADWTGHALDQATGTGAGEATIAMRLPLNELAQSSVKGSLQFGGNDVRVSSSVPGLENARGRLEFSERGFSISQGAARVLGGDATFDGGTQADGSIRFKAQGTVTADALRKANELGFVARLAPWLQGQTPYQLSIGFDKGQSEIDVTSTLIGIESNLPSPMNKAASSALPLHYQVTLQPDSGTGPAGATRDSLRVEVGKLIQANYRRQLDASGVARVLSGGVGVMEAAPMPASGVEAVMRAESIDIDEWKKVVDALQQPAAATGGAPQASNGGSNEDTGGDSYLPDVIALTSAQVSVHGRKLTRVVAGATTSGGIWKLNLAADQLDGYAEYRPTGSADNAAGVVYARMARLDLPESEVDSVENLLDEQPDTVPALDIVVDDFTLRGMKLGRIDIQADNRDGPRRRQAREWTLSRLNVTSPDGQLTATGRWAPAADGQGMRRTSLDFQLDVANGGGFLERLGFPQVVRGAKGQLSGKVSWAGSPMSIDYPSMAGNVHVAISQGQFLKVEPGAARLLGVLSLQAIPRRLTLDFRDLFQQGFAFDNVVGDVDVSRGVASTNNLRMRGAQAAVLMAGSADLQAETQDLRVVVVPEINAGTASLAYAVINPAIGLGTFLAQLFLKQPLTRAGTREFHISGSWDDPKIERVARRLGDPIPEFGTDPAQPGAPASQPAPTGAGNDEPAPVRPAS